MPIYFDNENLNLMLGLRNATSSASLEAEIIDKAQFGIGAEINHINDNLYEKGYFHYNPMVIPWEI